jgi:hypothetical protein
MIFTIGYGAQKKPRLPALKLDELAYIREQLNAIIVDVRARPYSRWRPEMNCPALEERFGDGYLSMASLLGNQERSLPGRVVKRGIQELIDWESAEGAVAQRGEPREPPLLMCTEKAPGDCHRHHAIAMQLPVDSVIHLYHDGGRWVGIEAHELQRSLDDGDDYGHLLFGKLGIRHFSLDSVGWVRHRSGSPSEELIACCAALGRRAR